MGVETIKNGGRLTGFRDKEVFYVFSEVLNFFKKIVAIWDFLISTNWCAYLRAFECKKRIWNIFDSFFYKNSRMWENRLKWRVFYFRAQFWPTFQKQVIFSFKRVIRNLTSPFEWAMKFWFWMEIFFFWKINFRNFEFRFFRFYFFKRVTCIRFSWD